MCCACHFRLALLAPNVWGGTLDAGPHTDRFYNKWGRKYWDLWQKSLPLILALSSPGLPEIIIFGHVGAILRRPTMFRMHILNQQVDERYHQRDGGSTTVYTAYTVNFVYTVHTVYTVDTIQTAFTRTAWTEAHMHVYNYILLLKVRALLGLCSLGFWAKCGVSV